MWFKQIQLFQLIDSLHCDVNAISAKLEPLVFTPCFPSMPQSLGWVSPIEEEGAPLVQMMNGNLMICLQFEEKILPAAVIRQELVKKMKEIEMAEGRRVNHKEKLDLKDELTLTLLPRAFSRLTRLYAYIDTRNQWLVIGSNHAKKVEQFMTFFKKTFELNVHPFQLNKLSHVFTHWLKHKSYPSVFSIENACFMQDPEKQNRMIRCKHQDLFSNGIQSLLKEGCVVKQLALCWADRVHFLLSDTLSLTSIQFQDEITNQVKEMEPETLQQIFNADFLIMTETLTELFKALLEVFLLSEKEKVELAVS